MTFDGGKGFWKSHRHRRPGGSGDWSGASIDAGINFFDTADVYSEGESEKRSASRSRI